MKKISILLMIPCFSMVLISCSKHIPNKSDCISDGAKNYSCPSPPTILKKNKPKETKVANVNVQVYI